MILSKCVICGSKKSIFIKNQEAKGLLSNLGIRTPLIKVLLLGDTLFWNKQEIQTIFTNMNLITLVFNMIWLIKMLAKRKAFDKDLRDKTFNIANNPKCNGYQRGLASMVYNFFDKKPAGSGVNMQAKPNEKLAEELHKPIIRRFKERTVYSVFKDNIWGADLAAVQLISKFNKGFRFLLCVIVFFSKYAWAVPLKDKKDVTITNAFHKILKESKRRQSQFEGRKANKIWVDKGIKFYNRSFKIFLKDNDIEMYSIHNDGKSVVAERFVRPLITKIYKYMTSISKDVYTDNLDDK